MQCIRAYWSYYQLLIFNQVFNKNLVIVMLNVGGGRACGRYLWVRSITLVCFGLLTPNLLYGKLISKGSLGLLPRCLWSRSRSLLLKTEIQFPLNNLSLVGPIDTKLAVCVAYIKTQLEINTQVSVIKVKVTVTNDRNSVSAQ